MHAQSRIDTATPLDRSPDQGADPEAVQLARPRGAGRGQGGDQLPRQLGVGRG